MSIIKRLKLQGKVTSFTAFVGLVASNKEVKLRCQ